ncbi:hypothetical protein DCAR_0205480 [Daucus carota subsp. sativus]|uniref:Uncharacterized protein n=2 Tax=Daucus carota subsp. sativus TaxID=79200 RepID=A0A166CMY4_DAUCS|nr:hypothetical protein DCAR_0205480 [Daucus carota subsp. sativus]
MTTDTTGADLTDPDNEEEEEEIPAAVAVDKCGACKGASRVCKTECPFRPFFPADTADMAHLISSLFHKKGILRLMNACKTAEEVTSCRTRLFNVAVSLINGTARTHEAEISELKELVKTQAASIGVQSESVRKMLPN